MFLDIFPEVEIFSSVAQLHCIDIFGCILRISMRRWLTTAVILRKGLVMKQILAVALAMVLGFGAWVQAGETLRVGTNAEFMPFEFVDDDDQVVGFDIDMINAIGKAAGFEVQVVNQAFDTLIDALSSNKIDAAASGMTITDARKEKVFFSDPYYNAAQVLVVKNETPGFTKLEDIKGKKVSVQLGTTGAMMAEEVLGEENPDLHQFRKYNEAFAELTTGRVEVVVVDLPVAEAYVKRLGGIKISSPRMSEEEFGIAISKQKPELQKKINEGLKKIKDSGEFDAILQKWFGN